ncbi:SMP-30/gluconolactonase/LRE family protein [Achromobacter aloeverae]
MMAPLLPREWQTLATGCGFTEGPVAAGDEVFFVSVNRGLVYAAALDGSGTRIVVETGGGPNGAAVDASGSIWIAQNGGRVMESKSFAAAAGVQVVSGQTVRYAATDDVDGGFDAPNDCAFGPDGRLYFTDPHGRLAPSRGDGPSGRVWALDTATGAMELIAERLQHPNGLCFTADKKELWVSDTKTREILSFARHEGRWVSRVVDVVPQGGPDGIALDAAGSLWVAATDAEGVAVRSAAGDWRFIELGHSFPTNVAFAGPGLGTVVVTAARGGRLLAAPVEVPGLPLHTPRLDL